MYLRIVRYNNPRGKMYLYLSRFTLSSPKVCKYIIRRFYNVKGRHKYKIQNGVTNIKASTIVSDIFHSITRENCTVLVCKFDQAKSSYDFTVNIQERN